VVERKATLEETEELRRIWEEIGYRMADLPEEEFLVQTVEIVEEVERAPIFRSLRCSKCGELVAESRSIRIGDKVLCLVCAGEAINAVIGRGIVKIEKVPYRIIVDTYT
ncbi:MAG: TraR/DksA C4-type zinc finger protein, partial [Ignisphaera sp.]